MLIENKFLKIEIDDKNGSVLSLFDKTRNAEFIDEKNYGSLFKMCVPNNAAWTGQYVESSDAPHCEIRSEGHRTNIIYKGQKTVENKILDINATVSIELGENSDEAFFTLDVENNSEFCIDEIWFPKIGGLNVDRHADKDIAYFGYASPYPMRNCKGKASHNMCHSQRKVSLWSGIPSFHVERKERGGITLNHYATIPQQTFGVVYSQDFNLDNSTTAFGFVLHPFLTKKETYKSEKFGISLNDGNIKNSLDRYKEFLSKQRQPLLPPKDLKETVAMFNVQLRDFEGRYLRPIESLIPICEDLLKIGIKDICVWDMMFEIYYRAGNGFFLEDDDENRIQKLHAVVEKLKAMGMTVNTLVNFRLANENLKNYDKLIDNMDLKSSFGVRGLESYCIRSSTSTYFNAIYEQQGHPLCQNYEKFQNFAVNLGKRLMKECGFNSIFIDQPFGQHYCFDLTHGHKFGADDEVGAMQWVEKLQNELHKMPGYKYALGEVPDIFNTRLIELWWHWPLNVLNPSVLRYVLPSSLQTWVIDTTCHQYEISRAFSLGFIFALNTDELNGTIDQTPEIAERMKNLLALKNKVQKEIDYSSFIGSFCLKTESEFAVEANAYKTDKTLAIIAGSKTEYPTGGKVKVTIDSFDIKNEKAIVYSENGIREEVAVKKAGDKFVIEFNLDAYEVKVIVLDIR